MQLCDESSEEECFGTARAMFYFSELFAVVRTPRSMVGILLKELNWKSEMFPLDNAGIVVSYISTALHSMLHCCAMTWYVW